MSVIIDGTAGITTPAETVQGALTTTGNTILGDSSADTLNVGNGGLVKDASGTVSIGVVPPAYNTVKALQVADATSIYGYSNNESGFQCNAYYNSGWKYTGTSSASQMFLNGNIISWSRAASGTAGNAITWSESMRIDASGNLLVGTTSALGGKISVVFDGSATNGVRCKTTYATNGSQFVDFLNSGGTQIGYISQNGSTTVSYSTSSDYRLKNTIAPMAGALEKVALLKPVTYKWNADGSDGQGFIAHELQEVVPDCVTGEKDAVDAEGNPVHQGIDTSFLVATLTAAIQEQQALITQLQADVAALKALSA